MNGDEPVWLNIGLILVAFAFLPLVVGGFFFVRALAAHSVREDVLRELIDLLALACRRSLPFPEVLEGFAQSLADRGANTPAGRFMPGKRGRMSEASETAFKLAGEARAGGLPGALNGEIFARIVPQPFCSWIRAGHARGSLALTLETVRDQLRFDRRRSIWGLPLFAYLSLLLMGCGLFGEGAVNALSRQLWPFFELVEVPWLRVAGEWAPPLLAVGWFVTVLVVLPLSAARAGSRSRFWQRVPVIGVARRQRAWASRLRMLECSLRAGLTPLEALRLQADADDPVAARVAARVAEGEHVLRALGVAAPSASGAPLPDLVAELAADYERRHAARIHRMALATLPAGLVIAGVWVFKHYYQFFMSYGMYLESEVRPW